MPDDPPAALLMLGRLRDGAANISQQFRAVHPELIGPAEYAKLARAVCRYFDNALIPYLEGVAESVARLDDEEERTDQTLNDGRR